MPALLYIYALPVFLRTFDKDHYAQIVLIFNILSLSIIFEAASNYFFFNRFARRSERSIRRIIGLYIGTLWQLSQGLYGLSTILALVYYATNTQMFLGLAILFGVAPASLGSSLIFSFWQVHNKGYIGNITRSLVDILKGSGLLIGAHMDNGVVIAIVIYSIGFYLRFLIDLQLFSKSIRHAYLRNMPKMSRSKLASIFFTKTYPILATSFVSSVLLFLDKPISYLLFGQTQMVQLALAAELSSKVVIIQYAAGFAFTYYFGKVNQSSLQDLRLTVLFLSVVIGMILVFIVPLYIYAQEILGLWLGVEIADKSYQILRPLLIAQAIYMLSNVFEIRNTFTAVAQRNIVPYALMLLFYFGSLVLISDIGINAVPYSLIVAQTVALFYYVSSYFR